MTDLFVYKVFIGCVLARKGIDPNKLASDIPRNKSCCSSQYDLTGNSHAYKYEITQILIYNKTFQGLPILTDNVLINIHAIIQ